MSYETQGRLLARGVEKNMDAILCPLSPGREGGGVFLVMYFSFLLGSPKKGCTLRKAFGTLSSLNAFIS